MCNRGNGRDRRHTEQHRHLVKTTFHLSPGQFYAPWCGYCKKLEPVWDDVGAELKSSGSPVRVGKMDATAFSGEGRSLSGEMMMSDSPLVLVIQDETNKT